MTCWIVLTLSFFQALEMKQDLSLEALRKTKYQFKDLPKPLRKLPPPKISGKTICYRKIVSSILVYTISKLYNGYLQTDHPTP